MGCVTLVTPPATRSVCLQSPRSLVLLPPRPTSAAAELVTSSDFGPTFACGSPQSPLRLVPSSQAPLVMRAHSEHLSCVWPRARDGWSHALLSAHPHPSFVH